MSTDNPRNVRNFWLQGEIDGRQTKIATGPAGAAGGFKLTILVRENGAISHKRVTVQGLVNDNGELQVVTSMASDNAVTASSMTVRR